MSTNRELLFKYKKEGISDAVIYFALEECNGYDHLLLSQNLDSEIKDENRFVNAMNRYLNGEMIEYIFNKAYFLAKPFYVDKSVLIPRQETEQLTVDTIVFIKKVFENGESPVIADICTGSGAIAAAIEKEVPNAKIFATDISPEALEVAKKNVKNVELFEGNLVDPIIEIGAKLDVLICNPPYIQDETRIDEQVWKYEPHLALLASPGTKFYEEIFSKANRIMNKHYLMAFEIEDDMEKPLIELMNKYLDDVSYRFHKDIYDKVRFLYIIK